MTLGTVSITTPKTQVRRMSMVIWGPSGAGKTTLGEKLEKKWKVLQKEHEDKNLTVHGRA